MHNTIIDHIDIWTTAQELKTSNRGRSASNQSLLGIKKLRELILELAVRGKLVPQDPNDELASELLKRISAEKRRLIKEGKIKKQEVLSEVGEDEKPFVLPKGWEWQKLGNLGYIQTGGTPSKNDNSLFGSDVPFIKPGDIYPNYIDYSNEGLSFKGVESLGRLANEGSILMVCIGTIGKCNTINRLCTFNQQINSISPYGISSNYLLLSLNSKYFQDKAWEKSSSTTIAILNKGKWEKIGIPVPPLAEQHLIVAKVNELMALCDELEKQQTNSNVAHETLVATLLGSLTDAANPDSFDESWQRIANHFDILFTTEHSIDQLKQTILQLAVMGKLVPQNPKDEPSSELLKKIAKEKARLVKEGKIKKQAPLPEITEDEKPFGLPEGWEVSRLGTFTFVGTGSTPSRDRSVYYDPQEYNWVTSGETGQDFIFETNEKISALGLKETNVSIYPKGSLIIAMYGQGKTRGQISELMIDAGTNQACAAVVLINKEEAHRKYVKYFFKKAYEELRSHSAGGAQPNLNLGKVANTVIPIPPLAEQHRIGSKVDELFAFCDKLKERIVKAQTLQNQLAVAVVEQELN